jgi:hypothetical protein
MKESSKLSQELRIDLIVLKNDFEVAGIQVKPLTFKLMRREVITFNKNANIKWGKPVFYLYYDENEKFVNIELVKSELINL